MLHLSQVFCIGIKLIFLSLLLYSLPKPAGQLGQYFFCMFVPSPEMPPRMGLYKLLMFNTTKIPPLRGLLILKPMRSISENSGYNSVFYKY
jgi:hypothetical protein